MRGDLHMAAVEVKFPPHAFRIIRDRRAAVFLGFGNRRLLRCHLVDGFACLAHLLLGHESRLAVEVRVGKQPRRGAGVVENVEIVFVVIVAHPRASPDDLFEFHHRTDHPGEDDILAGGNIDAGGEQL